jgi:penicillin-binding protein-related factor A (putative recombinase)
LDGVGKVVEKKFKAWCELQGYYCYRLPDQVSKFSGSSNPCDFFLYHYPTLYMVECKATMHDSIPLSVLEHKGKSNLALTQRIHLESCVTIKGMQGAVLFAFGGHNVYKFITIEEIIAWENSGKRGSRSIRFDSEIGTDIPAKAARGQFMLGNLLPVQNFLNKEFK